MLKEGYQYMNYDWIIEAEKLFNEGLPYRRIAKLLNVNRKTVSYHLRKLGYKTDEKRIRHVDPNKLRKYDYSKTENIFEKIDTEEKAYWLGMLYADGYVANNRNTIALSLKEEDYNHIVKFRKFLNLTNKPIRKKIKHKDNKNYIGYEFSINNEKVKNDLCNLGCMPNKTFKIKFPSDEIVPPDLKQHFIRGYLDGDGCITHNSSGNVSVEILGTYDFLDGYQKWIGLHYNKVHDFKTTEIKHSMYAGKYAKIILNKLYENASIYLDRKYKLYLYYCRPDTKVA